MKIYLPNKNKKTEKLLNLIKENVEFNPFKMVNFIQWLSVYCNRPVVATGWNFPNRHICGLWFTHQSTKGNLIECILYDNRLPKPLQLHTILHEVAHILCGHQTVLSSITQFEHAVQNLSQFKIFCNNVAQRNINNPLEYNKQEQEAELLAHLIQVEIFLLKNEKHSSSIQQGQNYLQAIGCD